MGAAVGGAIALGIIALKQLSVWPFNRRQRVPQGTRVPERGEASSNDGATSRHRRRHARAWNPADD
jgi:hypothetical protein